MANLAWYWHRLRAMDPQEMLCHARKKIRQAADARRDRDWAAIKLVANAYPALPSPETAPSALKDALLRATGEIRAGRWQAFGHLELKVDDPPAWHRDCLAGVDLPMEASAFKLNHRQLPNGADIKLIWELSRWQQLTRLAQAAWLFDDEQAAEKCVLWLEDWVKRNPPFKGWNWISALETGLRLLQFTWIDALLSPNASRWGIEAELETLRHQIVPAHAWHAWRHRSFGSSANNHLLGELAGLIVASARWPALAAWCAPIAELQALWEHEVLAQFAPDGGNREQALNYHLFSWELCLHARTALTAAGRTISPDVLDRLQLARQFYLAVQVPADPWDYGDSDSATALPLFLSDATAVREWWDWMRDPSSSPAIHFWLKNIFPAKPNFDSTQLSPHLRPTLLTGGWQHFRQTGIAVQRDGEWTLRWDLSPLGYLATAAHGHLDALHLSLWFRGVAMVIDPGTGAYYAAPELRAWLASRAAHNGACANPSAYPERRGAFLWRSTHPVPSLRAAEDSQAAAEWPCGQLRHTRVISHAPGDQAWIVEDSCAAANGDASAFTIRWQFAPDTQIEPLGERRWRLRQKLVAVELEVSADWTQVELQLQPDPKQPHVGQVSPAFRQILFAPALLLAAANPGAGKKPCVLRTTFLASTA